MQLHSTSLRYRLIELFKAGVFVLLAVCFRDRALADSALVSTHFSYSSASANTVGLAGEFNSWQPTAMTKGADGAFTADVPLAPGTYGYKFVVNGNDWELDPNNAARKTIDGTENSAITVTAAAGASGTSSSSGTTADMGSAATSGTAAAPANSDGVLFTYSNAAANAVFLVGQFNSWNTSATPMQKDGSGTWSVRVPLTPGNYQYKLFVDGAWMLDPANSQQADDGAGTQNSVKVVGVAGDAASPAASGSGAGK